MLKQQLGEDLKKAVKDLGFETTDPDFIGADIVCTLQKNSDFGDYSSNIALQLAKQLSVISRQSSDEIAKEIVKNLGGLSYLSDIKIAGAGFINFFIKPEFLLEDLQEILVKGEKFGSPRGGAGSQKTGERKNIQVEFISANPTGPLTLANGRGGALGDTLANVLSFSGAEINREYYVNDTGNQIKLLGESVLAMAGKTFSKDEHYKGEYVKELAEKFGDKLTLESQDLGHILADYLIEHEIKPAIERLGVKFDEFYSERSLYERGLIAKAVNLLKEKDLAYEKEGALWFKASRFGDEKDRVLLTSEAGRGQTEPTYFLADIAHHLDNLEKGYQKRINFLGADHHSYGVRMQGAMEALGYKNKVEMILFQLVRLFKEGKEVRMSKRAGNFVTLDELLDLAGKDAVRFFFLMYAPNSHIDFDLDLAKEKSNKNPVYYVQYAYARISNILANSSPVSRHLKFKTLEKREEREIIKYLGEFPDLIKEISKNYQVQALPAYALRLADLLNSFYEACPVLQAESEELKEARLALIKAAKMVLGNCLNLMGIEAPEKM